MKRFFILSFLILAFFTFSSSSAHACNPPYDNTGCPPELNPDFNFFGVYQGLIIPINAPPEDYNLQHFQHPIDSAPQLTGLIQGNTQPTVTTIYQITGVNPPGYADLPGNYSPAVGFGTSPGQVIQVPQSPYDLGGGYEVQVLYADTSSITINYSLAGTPAVGYTIHIGNIQTNPSILALYQQSLTGANSLPTLSAFQELGISLGSEIIVALRDTGTLMDPRWIEDWWIHIYNQQNPLQPILSGIIGAFPPGYQPTLSCPSDDQGTLRPKAYSASCKIQKVPDKVTAKVEKFWVKTKITMKIDDAMTNLCNGTYYPQVTWNAQVGIDLSKTYYPQAGFGKSYTTNNPEAEYLADYITGSLFGDGEVPVLPKAWDNAGIFRKISTGWYEDEKKCDLTKIKNADYPVKLNILMGLTSYNQDLKKISCPPLDKPITDISWTIWRTANFIDSALWDAITNFTYQDTPGDILITSTEPPSQITTADQGSKQEASNKIRSALSVPHAQRTVDSARELVKILAPAGLENLNATASQSISLNTQEKNVNPYQNKTFSFVSNLKNKASSVFHQAKRKIIAFAQSKNLLAQTGPAPINEPSGNGCNNVPGLKLFQTTQADDTVTFSFTETLLNGCYLRDTTVNVTFFVDGQAAGGCSPFYNQITHNDPNDIHYYPLEIPCKPIDPDTGQPVLASSGKEVTANVAWFGGLADGDPASCGNPNAQGSSCACSSTGGSAVQCVEPPPPPPPPPPPCGLSFNKSQVTIKGDVDKKEPNKLNNVRKDPIIIEVNSPDSPPISGLSQNEANKIKAACDACIASGQSGCKCSVTLDYGTIIELEAAFPYNKTIWENFAKERESGFLNYFIPQGTGEGFKSDDNSSKIGYILYSLTAAKSTKDSTLEIIGGDSGTDIEGKIESGLYLFGAQKAKQCVSQRLFLPSFAGQPVECPNLL